MTYLELHEKKLIITMNRFLSYFTNSGIRLKIKQLTPSSLFEGIKGPPQVKIKRFQSTILFVSRRIVKSEYLL